MRHDGRMVLYNYLLKQITYHEQLLNNSYFGLFHNGTHQSKKLKLIKDGAAEQMLMVSYVTVFEAMQSPRTHWTRWGHARFEQQKQNSGTPLDDHAGNATSRSL